MRQPNKMLKTWEMAYPFYQHDQHRSCRFDHACMFKSKTTGQHFNPERNHNTKLQNFTHLIDSIEFMSHLKIDLVINFSTAS